MTVGDLEDKRVVEPATTVTCCNTTSISRGHNTSTGLWQDSNSKGQHDTSCVLTQWAEGCQSIKVSLNISKLRSASPVSGCLSSNCKASFKHLPTQWHIFLAYWRGCEGTGPGSSGEGRGCSCVGCEGREEEPVGVFSVCNLQIGWGSWVSWLQGRVIVCCWDTQLILNIWCNSTIIFFFSNQSPSPNSRGQKHVKNPSPDPTPTQVQVLFADYNGLQWTALKMNFNGLQLIQITMDYKLQWLQWLLQWTTNYNDYKLQWTTMDYNINDNG